MGGDVSTDELTASIVWFAHSFNDIDVDDNDVTEYMITVRLFDGGDHRRKIATFRMKRTNWERTKLSA
ncbi:hypothetical protein WUBG_11205, partial [Wuchereria bancrofti]